MQSIGKEDDKNSEGDSSDSDLGDFDEMRPSLFDEYDIEAVERAGLEKTQETREIISANASSDLFGELINNECKDGIQTSSDSEESLEADSVGRRDQRELDSDIKSIKDDIKSVKEKDKQNNNLNKGGDHSSNNRYTVESKNHSQRNVVTNERDKIDSRKGNEIESTNAEDAFGEKVLEKEVGEQKQKIVDGYELGESYEGGRTRISRVAPVEDDNEMSDSSGDCGMSEGKNEEKIPSKGNKQCERHHDSSTTREEKIQRDSGEQCTTMDSHMTDDNIKQRERSDGTSREISEDEVCEEEDDRKYSHQRYDGENEMEGSTDQLQRKGNMKVLALANKVEKQRESIVPDKAIKNSYTGSEQSPHTNENDERQRLNRDKEIVDSDDEMRCSNNGKKEPLQEQRLVKEDSKKQEERQSSDSSEEEAGIHIEIGNSVAGKSRTARSSSSKESGLQCAEGDKFRESADGMSNDASASSSEWTGRSEFCEQSTVKKHSIEGGAVNKLKLYVADSKQRERSNPPDAGKSCQTRTLEKLKIVCPKESEETSEKVEVESAGFESLELDHIMMTERMGKLTTPTKQKIVVKNVNVVPSRERASFNMPENHAEVAQRRMAGASLEPMIASILDSLPVILRVLSPIPLSPARGGMDEGEEEEEEEEEDDNELNLHQRRLSPLSPPDASCFLPPFSASERALSPLPRTPVPPEDYPEHGGDTEPSEVIMTNFHAVVPEGVINVRPQAVPSSVVG
ncbi:hypothetical protein BSL78_15495 [Apostichopus japonicus]|uniref:Uncharacterized protein n=1 Tax=Stichopus japonicus TaxID=307972 RepID=A0A2G8KI00_STIJA|nr:hypothetical protein BSL78_15495 [Apostichopus japonicus]